VLAIRALPPRRGDELVMSHLAATDCWIRVEYAAVAFKRCVVAPRCARIADHAYLRVVRSFHLPSAVRWVKAHCGKAGVAVG
jgi:hypothetical protein